MLNFREELRKIKDEKFYSREVEEILRKILERLKKSLDGFNMTDIEVTFDGGGISTLITIVIENKSAETSEKIYYVVGSGTDSFLILGLLKRKFEIEEYEVKNLENKKSSNAFTVKIS